jgi:hypothetical protein
MGLRYIFSGTPHFPISDYRPGAAGVIAQHCWWYHTPTICTWNTTCTQQKVFYISHKKSFKIVTNSRHCDPYLRRILKKNVTNSFFRSLWSNVVLGILQQKKCVAYPQLNFLWTSINPNDWTLCFDIWKHVSSII